MGKAEDSTDRDNEANEPMAQWKENEAQDEISSKKTSERSAERAFRRRVILQTALTYGYLCHGLCTCFSGAALPDLRVRTNSNWEEISRAVVGRGIGMFFGAIGGGFLCDRFNGSLLALLALGPTLEALGSFVIPWCTVWWTLMAMFSIQGITEGLLISAASKLSFQLWGREAAAPVFATSLAFGLGAIVGPQIIEPFLGTHSHVLEPQNNNTVTATSLSLAINSSLTHEKGATAYKFAGESLYAYNQTNSNTLSNISGSYLVKRIIPNNDSRIEYAYTIGGIMSVLAAIAFLVLQYVSNRCKWNVYGDHTAIPAEPTDKKPKDSGSALQSGKCAKGDTVFGVQLLGLMLFFYIHIVGGEWALDKFMFAYITEGPLHREPFEASLMVSIFWGCYTGGRGISALISKWVKPSFILGTVVLGQLLAGILLCTEAGNNVSVFWFVNCLYGLAIGPVYPGALVWVNRYIQVSGMVLAVVLIGGSAGGFIYQWIVGIVFQLYGLDSLGYVMLVEGICITTTFVLLEITGRRHGTRFKKTPGNNNDHGRKGDDPEDVHVSMLMLSQV